MWLGLQCIQCRCVINIRTHDMQALNDTTLLFTLAEIDDEIFLLHIYKYLHQAHLRQ